MNSLGLVYCGYSFFLPIHRLNDSSTSDSSLITQGNNLVIQSINTIAANSQLVSI